MKNKIEPYQYNDSDSVYRIWGDLVIVVDTVSTNPIFKWTYGWPDYITGAASLQSLKVINGTLSNSDQIIWMWNPGMETGERGKVSFLEGKPVKNKNILIEKQPLPLQNGLYN